MNNAIKANEGPSSRGIFRIAPTLMEVLRQTAPSLQENQVSVNSKHYEGLILNSLQFSTVEAYQTFVDAKLNELTGLPNRFNTLQEYQARFRAYIETASHLDSLTSWRAVNDVKRPASIVIQRSLIQSSKQLNPNQYECEIGLEIQEGTLQASMRGHLSLSIFLLKSDSLPDIMCLSQSGRPSKSSLLRVRFLCNKATLEALRESSKSLHTAVYLTSLLDWSRDYLASYQLQKNPCMQRILTGDVSPILPAPNDIRIDGFVLNRYQKHFIHQVLVNDGLSVLYGPPGTGKTKTLSALISQAVILGWRVLVTAPSNHALGELATRFYEQQPHALIMIGIRDKLPEGLKHNFLQGWSSRVLTSLDNLDGLLSDIQEEALSEETLALQLAELITQLNLSARFRASYCCQFESYQRQIQDKSMGLSLADIIYHMRLDIIKLRKELRASADGFESELLNQIGCAYFATPSSISRIQSAPFNLIVIDEAALLPEVHCFPVLGKCTDKLVVAGDPKQLSPHTAFEQVKAFKFNRSLLARLLLDLNVPHIFLSEQYRMHPLVCEWTSAMFYRKQLKTANAYRQQNYVANTLSQPLAFFDIHTIQSDCGTGYINPQEASFVVRCVHQLRAENPDASIGVIAFYAEQSKLLSAQLKDMPKVSVSTVDGFQGRECDYIVISGTRSNHPGFLKKDPGRINVALTRAKSGLIFIGNEKALSMSDVIKNFIQYTKKINGRVYTQQDLEQLLTAQVAIELIEAKDELAVNHDAWNQQWAHSMLGLQQERITLDEEYQLLLSNNPDLSEELELVSLEARLATLKEEQRKQNETLSTLTAKHKDMSSNKSKLIQKRFEDKQAEVLSTCPLTKDLNELSAKQVALQSEIDSQHARIKQEKDSLEIIDRDTNQRQREFHLMTYEAHKDAFLQLDESILQYIGFSTSDLVLHCAAFYRLSYIKFHQENYWEAIFYALCVQYSNAYHDDVASNRLDLYKEGVVEIIDQSMDILSNNKGVWAHIKTFSGKFWEGHIKSHDRYRQAVMAHWMIHQSDCLDIETKILGIKTLKVIYSLFNYAAGIVRLYQYFEEILPFIKEPSDIYSKQDRDLLKGRLLDEAKNLTDMLDKEKTNFHTTGNAFDLSKFMFFCDLTDVIKNSKVGYKTQRKLDKLTSMRFLGYESMQTICCDGINEGKEEIILPSMLLNYQLMLMYIEEGNIGQAGLMFDKLCDQQGNRPNLFLMAWAKYKYAEFLSFVDGANYKRKASQLIDEALVLEATLFEIDIPPQLHKFRFFESIKANPKHACDDELSNLSVLKRG